MKYFRSSSLWTLPSENIHSFQVIQAESVEEALGKDVDCIDLDFLDYQYIVEKYPSHLLEMHHLGFADCYLKIRRQGGDQLKDRLSDHRYQLALTYKDVFLKELSGNHSSLQTNYLAVLVGDERTVANFFPALSQLGYANFKFVVKDPQTMLPYLQSVLSKYIGLNADLLSFADLAEIKESASALIVDVDHQQEKELIQGLTYFNFLVTQALFLDVRAVISSDLEEEAERAEMTVIKSQQLHTKRFEHIEKLLQAQHEGR